MDELEIFKALSNKTRLQILAWLKEPNIYFEGYETGLTECKTGVCVGLIHKKSGLTQSTISEYLAVLQKAELVTATKIGQWTYYKRNENTILALSKIISSKL